MPTPPEQVADEALALRTAELDWAGRVARSASNGDEDAVTRARAIELARWAGRNPALDAIAEARQQAIAELRDAGVTPEPGCLADADDVHLRAVQDAQLSHRYRILRLEDGRWGPVGAAWLTADWGAAPLVGLYAARVDGAAVHGNHHLFDALDRLASAIADVERCDREQRAKSGRP